MLKELIEKLRLELDYTLDNDYYFKNELMVVCLASPHEVTDYEYILRANPTSKHNVWKNCEFEVIVRDADKAIMELEKYYLELSEGI